jgi:hypothetical protein
LGSELGGSSAVGQRSQQLITGLHVAEVRIKMVINLKTAKALGLKVPALLPDDVIE